MDEEQQTQKETKPKIPNFLICSVCGAKKHCNTMSYNKLIETYKTDEEIKKNYKCRECKKTA